MPPKVDPNVATPCRCRVACNTVATTIATNGPGTRLNGLIRGTQITDSRLNTDSAVVGTLSCGMARNKCQRRS